MERLDIEKFDPTVAELTAMVEASKKDTLVIDLSDKARLEIVHANRMILKNARVTIEKKGKELREDANAYAKAVIAKEKELKAIIEPEEERLAELEDQAKQLLIRQERERKLPERLERFHALNFGITPADELILSMDDVQFETFLSDTLTQKVAEEQARTRAEQEAKQAELNAKERELKEAEAEIMREKELAAAQQKAREEGERKAREAMAREEVAKKADEERKAAQAKAEIEKLEKKKKYVAFLKSHGWTEETKEDFKTEETALGYVLYKKLGIFTK